MDAIGFMKPECSLSHLGLHQPGRPQIWLAGLMLLWAHLFVPPALIGDWPGWLGPQGNNHVKDVVFDPDLSGYRVAWEKQVGLGYASVTLSGDRALTLGHDGDAQETLYCFHTVTGAELWRHTYPGELIPRMHKGGPNASATVHQERVYALSKDGLLQSLSLESGELIWKVRLTDILNIPVPGWGFASSPIWHHEGLYLAAGKVARLDPESGTAQWVAEEAYHPGYATPVLFGAGAQKWLAAMDGKGISIRDPISGRELARHPFKVQFDMQATSPLVMQGEDALFVATNMGSECLDFDGQQLVSRWRSREISHSMNQSILLDGVAYGIDGKQGSSQSRMVAVDLDQGRLLWAEEGFGYGSSIGINRLALSLTEKGELRVTALSAEGYNLLSFRKVLSETCWTTPTFSDGRIFVRNDLGHVVCLQSP